MHGKYYILLTFSVVFFASNLWAQTDEQALQDLVESVADQLDESVDLTMVIDQIQFVQKNPIQLNQADASVLNTLYFLNALQVQQIVEYIQKYGPLLDIAELQTLTSMDLKTLQLLQKVSTLDAQVLDFRLKNIFAHSNHHFLMRNVNNIRQNQNTFEGSPGRYYLRYQMISDDNFQANITLDKDAGEYFWSRRYPYRIDFVSGNVVLKPKKWMNQVVLGDYHLQYGQGLILWTGFAMGISPDITSIARKSMGLKPYNSATEFNLMRGAAATFSVLRNKLQFTPFYSSQKIDATLNDSLQISSIIQTGYHRTNSEINRKQNLSQKSAGMVASLQYKQWQLGAIFQWLDFGLPFEKSRQWYENSFSKFKTQRNTGLNYQFTFRNMYVFGETALQNENEWATINGVLMSMSKNASLSVLYRKYSLNYQAINGQAISENTKNQNESGLYMGLDFSPLKKLKVQVYADWFSFPWLKNRVDAPTSGNQMMLQAIYQFNKKEQLLFRFRSRNKTINQSLQDGQNFNILIDNETKNVRLQYNTQPNAKWLLENRIDWVQFQSSVSQQGFLVYQDAEWKLSHKFRLGARSAYFKTEGYDSRIYTFENNVLYAFGFNIFQGQGWRNYLNFHYKLNKKMDAWCRMANTKYLKPQNLWKNEITFQLAFYL